MKTVNLRYLILGSAFAVSMTQIGFSFHNSQKAYAQESFIGESIPNYILSTSGQPDVAVFEGRREAFALGCPEIRNVWSAISSRSVTSTEFNSLLSINPVVADLHCDGRIKGYKLSDEGPGLLLIGHRDGTQARHYINSPLFLEALRSGGLIARNGSEFRADHPQRGNDLRVSLADTIESTSTEPAERKFPLSGSQRDELGDHRRMETTITISNNGRIDGRTRTWTRDHWEGFTGSVVVAITDIDGNILYQTDNQRRFGVSCLFCGGGDDRTEPWSEVMPEELLDKVSGYAIAHAHSPITRLTEGDIETLAEIFKEVQEEREGQQAAP